jgi:hypothetical protein
MKILVCEKHDSYIGEPYPRGYLETAEEVESFMKSRKYYIRSHMQSGKGIIKALKETGVCTFFRHTGKRFRISAGYFLIIRKIEFECGG